MSLISNNAAAKDNRIDLAGLGLLMWKLRSFIHKVGHAGAKRTWGWIRDGGYSLADWSRSVAAWVSNSRFGIRWRSAKDKAGRSLLGCWRRVTKGRREVEEEAFELGVFEIGE